MRALPKHGNASLTLIQGNRCIEAKMFDFRFNTLIPSLNQGRGSVFKVRECAQSIPRLEKPKNRRFSHKNPKMSDFRFKTPTPSLNQGQGSIFTFWGCAQSISHMILPLKVTFLEKKFFFENWSQTGPPPLIRVKCFHSSRVCAIDSPSRKT